MIKAWLLLWLSMATMVTAKLAAQQSGGIVLNPQVATLAGAQLTVPPGVGQPVAYLEYTAAPGATPEIRNIVSFSINEASNSYIPEDFNASIVVKLEYGTTGLTEEKNISFTVNYAKAEGAAYNARKYFSFEGAKYVRVSVVSFTPSVSALSNGVQVSDLLILENEMRVTRYYSLASTGNIPGFQGIAFNEDALSVSWELAEAAGHNQYQLEWTWLSNDMASVYYNSGTTTVNTDLLFHNNATRVDIPYNTPLYDIPLLYDGAGKLYYRVRGVNLMSSGTRVDGPWSDVQNYTFAGHGNDLNWQVNTSFAEEGKRKTVIQYFDGSLRSRQTVTKDNVSNTTVTAETFYDGQGRPAVQILPVPGMSNVIGYTKNLNLFNTQAPDTDPAKLFDLVSASAPAVVAPPLDNAVGAANYYSTTNDQKNIGANKNIPDAEGYPYTLTRYTPDGTGRIASQSGVGLAMRMGGGHETKYYYGTPAQEELDALFGTEVGYKSHYFKNMVQDANGQMSVSYVDMHGRTIATALAGLSPETMLAVNNETDYPGQGGINATTRNLLGQGGNAIRTNSIEALSTILVPAENTYSFHYKLDPASLLLPQCNSSTSLSYDCMYDLEFSITDESGETAPIVKRFNNVNPNADDDVNSAPAVFTGDVVTTQPNNIEFVVRLKPGSYSVRKTLSISERSLQRYKDQYLEKGLCKTAQQIIDSVQTVLKAETGCETPAAPTTCEACLAAAVNAADTAHCLKICGNTSHRLDVIRSMMLADMMPYTGQYAREEAPASDPENVYGMFDIFAPGNNSFRYPYNLKAQTPYYLDANGQIDVSIHPDPANPDSKLATITKEDYVNLFSFSWAESLLPYHPEINKLEYAEQHLREVYDWMDEFSKIETYNDALNNGFLLEESSFHPMSICPDPFFGLNGTPKSTMGNIVGNGGYYQGLSLWQIAYGEAVCKTTYLDQQDLNNCYLGAPSSPSSMSLTTAQANKAWNIFKGLYRTVRDSMLLVYLDEQTYVYDQDALIGQGYRLHFANTKREVDQHPEIISWYPTVPGEAPNLNMADSAKEVYASRCSTYIEQWRNQLAECPAIAAMTPTARESILTEMVTGMEAVCQKGTDSNNPYGASSVAPGTPYDSSPRSFEEVIEGVLSAHNIARSSLCNPFVIESPKPYGKGPVFFKAIIGALDTCTCSRMSVIRAEAAAASYSPYILSSLNQYLWQTYGDTLSSALFNAMNAYCSSLNRLVCDPGAPCPSCRVATLRSSSEALPPGCRDTVVTYPLAEPQVLPEFLKCGFVKISRCLTCDSLSAFTSRFKTYLGTNAPYLGSNLDSNQIKENILFAKYLNYYSGLQYNWQDYVKAAVTAGCPLVNGAAGAGGNQTVLCRSSTSIDDIADFGRPTSPCQSAINMSISLGTTIYEQRKEQLLADFESQYRAKCLDAIRFEEFTVSDTLKEYHYTLYYYDMAGNLVKTVPPKGVRPDYSPTFIASVTAARASNGAPVRPGHLLVTDYRYNSLNQVVVQHTPDAGTSKFWYDKLGRLAVSQNALQFNNNTFSYTVYDELGRIREVGQKPQSANSMSQLVSQDPGGLAEWLMVNGGTREQITGTVYDIANTDISSHLAQQNLRNRVSYSYTQKLATDNSYDAATFYTYDIHGNVDILLQDYKGAITDGVNRMKLMRYQYDLVSGKVNKVSYQPGKPDAFYHRYLYDAENKIIVVSTSRDSLYWEEEASYSYYKHGPLFRTLLGQQHVQGVDYNYTLQGWLKGINQLTAGGNTCAEGSAVDALVLTNRSANQPATYTARSEIRFEDGFESVSGDAFETFLNPALLLCQEGGGAGVQESIPVARDAYQVGLHYYPGDYKAIAGATAGGNILPGLEAAAAPLFNGNIAAMSVNIPKLGDAKVYNYHYDQLNRLRMMDAYNGLNTSTGIFTPIRLDDYQERVAYDPNGNILHYTRNGTTSGGLAMDRLRYEYAATNNQLLRVKDTVATNGYTEDVKYVPGTTQDYVYDPIGNLSRDEAGNLISWNVYGKIKEIVKSAGTISYTYDAAGNRISKTYDNKTTVYVRDASGNVMSVYEKTGAADFQQVETHLYGSSRLGIQKELTVQPVAESLTGGFEPGIISTFTRGEKFFELSNHLGNVLATVSDRKIPVSGNGATIDYYNADVVSAQDYYPFGMLQPGRSYNAGGYRYGFNGKEKDDEVKGDGVQYDYGFRIYDARLGRFLSVDPLTKSYPWYTPYQFAGNKPIRCIDLDGLEELSANDQDEIGQFAENLAPSLWNRAINGLDNIVMVGLEYSTTDNFEGRMIRKQLERQGYNTTSLDNKTLGKAFSLRFENRKPVIVPETNGWQNLLEVTLGVLDASTVMTAPSASGGSLLMIQISPVVKAGIGEILKGLKLEARISEFAGMVDSKTKQLLRSQEASAAAIFEDGTGSTLRVAGKEEAGDFIGTAGKYARKSIDHIGGWMPGKNNMKQFFASLDKHFGKADVVLLDLRNFSKEEAAQISKYISEKHAAEAAKVVTIQ